MSRYSRTPDLDASFIRQLENMEKRARLATPPAEGLGPVDEDPSQSKQPLDAFMARKGDIVRDHLVESVGLARHELSAEWAQIPPAIQKLLPKTGSFGLVGGFGSGKTFAIAARIKRNTIRRVEEEMTRVASEATPYQLEKWANDWRLSIETVYHWCNWPNDIAAKRAMLFQDRGAEVEDWIADLQHTPKVLVLDDIGADRPTAQDWAGEVLGRIIDERLRHQPGPTIWTSNLKMAELGERYGARTYSRLQALAPPIMLPPLPDLRLKRGA